MSDDIVNRLRTWLYETPVCMEAADEIERLTAENERLRALITIIAERHSRVGDLEYDDVIAAAVSGCQQRVDNE